MNKDLLCLTLNLGYVNMYRTVIPNQVRHYRTIYIPVSINQSVRDMPSSASKFDQKIIGSLQKAIDILNLFNAQNPELGITDIAETLAMPKSTVAGLVYTLKVNGYLGQNPQNRKYRLGFKLVELSNRLLNQIGLRQVALHYLEMLRDWCNEGVNMAVHDGGDVIYIERLFGTNLLAMRSEIGKREPVHSTALGKAILSHFSNTEINDIIGRYGLPALTTNTITDDKQFLTELRKTKEQGYALDNEENELGGRCVAAPILDYTARPVAAVSISAPVQRLPLSKIPVYGSMVKETAAMISRQLGYSKDEPDRSSRI